MCWEVSEERGVRSVGELDGECRHSFCRCECLLICKALNICHT